MRIVVTGRNPDGRSVFVEDSPRDPLVASGFPGLKSTPLWAADQPPTTPSAGARPGHKQFFPPAGGHRFFVLTIDPDLPDAQPPSVDQLVEFEALFPGLLETYESDDPGMHTSDTIDFGIVLSGSVVLELDDREERTLSAGDTFVQNATRHRWRNPGPGPVSLAVFMLGAERTS